jgi:hypothetical protein
MEWILLKSRGDEDLILRRMIATWQAEETGQLGVSVRDNPYSFLA